jgi:hypothetical protein
LGGNPKVETKEKGKKRIHRGVVFLARVSTWVS